MTASVPQIMSRIWDGDADEYFSASDMIRVEYNLNIVAESAGVDTVEFLAVDKTSQFRYDEAQKIEDLISEIGAALGISVQVESSWAYNRTICCVDFERWEANIWTLYESLGGYGERVASDKFLHVAHATLFASEWLGAGPFYQDFGVPIISSGSDTLAYLSESSSVIQRMDGFNARLQLTSISDYRGRIYAHGIKPNNNLQIEITTLVWDMYSKITLNASSWAGSGPWTQTVDIGTTVANAVVGSDERNSTAQVDAIANAVIGVSAISGSEITIRAIGIKPTIDIYATVASAETEASRCRLSECSWVGLRTH